MAVLMTKDKKEIIVTCKCGCESSFHIMVDDREKDNDQYAFLCFMKGNFYAEQNDSFWAVLTKKCKKIWSILRNKDFYYSDTVMNKEQYELFKEYINQF